MARKRVDKNRYSVLGKRNKRPSWVLDPSRLATKIKSASGNSDPQKLEWKTNPTRSCPKCFHVIDNSDVVQDWPGLPRGVKFDPGDQEIIWHLMTKVGVSGLRPHPFLDEFIPTVDEDDGICYTHPKNLPGVEQDGCVSHFFHKAIKAYNTGTRKRRKIHDEDFGDVRWHKTGRTKPVVVDGVQRGCKKIMVLYGGKSQKTNWVMHQYHLGTEEDEKDGEYMVSKIFYQQPQTKQGDKIDQDLATTTSTTPKQDPVTPTSVTPEPIHSERQFSEFDPGEDILSGHRVHLGENCETVYIEEHLEPVYEKPLVREELNPENHDNDVVDNNDDEGDEEDPRLWESRSQYMLDSQQLEPEEHLEPDYEKPLLREELNPENHDNNAVDNNDNQGDEEDPRLWESGSQYMLDSQQLVQALSLCDDLLQSQSPNREGDANVGAQKNRPRLSDYAELGTEHFKKDLEECQNLVLDPSNIELDTPPEFRLSQLEFGSQDSFLSWGGTKNIG